MAFNSIAAFEAIQEGYPAITLGPNAASFLSEKEIKNVDNPYFADDDKIREHSLYLSACQFEMDYKGSNTFNIGSNTTVSLNEVIKTIEKYSGKKAKIKNEERAYKDPACL